MQIVLRHSNTDYADYWDNKKPKAIIEYNGRYLPLTKRKLAVPVQLFITPNDPIIVADIRSNNLEISNFKDINTAILSIFRVLSSRIKYKSDTDSFGVPEVWLFQFELRKIGCGDCEEYSHQLVSYLIAAGVPRYRVREVCGLTYNNFGHSTVYVLGDDNKTWYHLEATRTNVHETTLTQLPTSKSSDDLYGISDVWFSFNDINAYHLFETDKSAKAFDEECRNIIIKEI